MSDGRNSRTPKQWANLVRKAWQNGVESIFETGRLLCEARSELIDEKWMPLFESRQLPFGLRTAERLMAIARDSRLVDSTYRTKLPPYWRTIDMIRNLLEHYPGIAASAFDDGTINPEVQQADIQLLLNRSKRAEKFRDLAIAPLPDDQSHIIYADPPWAFKVWEESSTYGAALEHYPVMELEELCALPIGVCAPADAVIFMWTTSPMLREAFEVLDSWGFEYKTGFVWDKEKQGMGYYVRNQHELLLIGARGDFPLPDPNNKAVSVIRAARGTHSVKPHVVYEIIERMYPDLSKREFFARYWRKGWLKPWGNMTPLVEAAE